MTPAPTPELPDEVLAEVVRQHQEVIVVIDHAGTLVYANPSVWVLGWTPEELVGRSAGIYYGNTGNSTFITLEAERADLPFDAAPDGPLAYSRGDERFLVAGATIPGSRLAVVTEMPMAQVLLRPRNFLRRLTVGVLVLMVLGAGGAWLISRGITRPVLALDDAAAGRLIGRCKRVSHGSRRSSRTRSYAGPSA